MKIIKRVLFAFVLAVTLFFLTRINTYASQSALSLHEKTKIYSSNNSDYFSGCESNDEYKYIEPAITVLTHGFNGNASHWSNTKDSGDGNLFYNKNSLVNKIALENNNEIDIYVAEVSHDNQYEFVLKKYDVKFEKGVILDRIDDASKHILLIFQSGTPDESNDYVYKEFENVIDTVSLQYKSLTGKLPRLNLVGHSRGGITNIMYATDHPYNVANIYSLGTPYNGSALGNFNPVLDMLGYRINGDELPAQYKPGVESLLDPQEARRIRDRWNEAYKSDVQAHVIALGSATSLNYAKSFIADIANGNSEYSKMVTDYVELINFIIDLINTVPALPELTFNIVEGLANVLGIINVNIYDVILSKFNSTWSGALSVEEGNRILELYQVVNGEAVLLDDLFIDVNSQLGYFKDGPDYKGFNRYLKIFQPSDLTENRSCPNLPAVVHNLEAMNYTYTNFIASDLVYGKSSTNTTKLDEFGTFNGEFTFEKTLEFTAEYTGLRKITANTPYKVFEKGGREIEAASSYNFEEGKTYYIVLESNSLVNASLSIDVVSNFSGSNTLNKNGSYIYYVTGSGFFALSSSQANVEFYNLDLERTGFVSLNGSKKYIIVKNKSNNNITTTLSLKAPTSLSADNVERTYQAYNVLSYKNTSGKALNYSFVLPLSSNVIFYNASGNVINYSVSTGTKKTYNITLNNNETIYVEFINQTSALFKINEDQLFFYINGVKVAKSSYNVYQGYSYTITLGTEGGSQTSNSFVFTQHPDGNYFSLNGNSLVVYSNAKINTTATIIHNVYTSKSIVFKVIPPRNLNFSISNNQSITLSWNMQLGNEDYVSTIKGNISSNGNLISVSITLNSSDDFNVSYSLNDDELGKLNTTATFTFVSININGVAYNSSNFNSQTRTFNGLYSSGSGTGDDPYTISCQRHLQNIVKNNSKAYKLTSSITLTGEWTPIYFTGSFNGNYRYIYYLDVNCSGGSNYGLFSSNYGTISKLYLKSPSLTSTLGKSNAWAGALAGYNGGTISSCYVYEATINATTAKATFGSLVGYNVGTISDSGAYSCTLKLSGYGGGLVGKNSGTISSCSVSGLNLTYIFVKPSDESYSNCNGSIGGLCGRNTGTISDSTAYGNIYWNNTTDNNRDIKPSIGKLVGSNTGTISNCSSGCGYSLNYYYWYFIGWYDQSERCFKVDNGLIGYSG